MIAERSGWQHKWWWLVDMISARSVFHSKVWHFNFSGNRTAVLPSLAISPLTVVLLQAGIYSKFGILAFSVICAHFFEWPKIKFMLTLPSMATVI